MRIFKQAQKRKRPLPHVFKALGDSNRLRILNLLLSRSFCVCEPASILDLPQSLVSRHLGRLSADRLVTDQRRGMQLQYSFAAEAVLNAPVRIFLRRAGSAARPFLDDRLRCERSSRDCWPPTPARRQMRVRARGRHRRFGLLGEPVHVDR